MNYPIGTNDFKELFKKDFQKDLFKNTPQFYFMGQNDENDAIPYADGYDDNERELVYKLIGKEMQPKRWNHCQEIYRNLGVNATLKTYEGFGHEFPKNITTNIKSVLYNGLFIFHLPLLKFKFKFFYLISNI